jgi:hypothetical protein
MIEVYGDDNSISIVYRLEFGSTLMEEIVMPDGETLTYGQVSLPHAARIIESMTGIDYTIAQVREMLQENTNSHLPQKRVSA